VTVLNTPGTIDSGYRGEVGVILANFGDADFTVKKGDKIAQAVIAPVTQPEIVETDTIDETDRGAGGFGSTGV
jgi:dUTP pyrophosphatase